MAKPRLVYYQITDKSVSSYSASEKSAFSVLDKLKTAPDTNKYITLEYNRWALDGEFITLDDNSVALWSNQTSDSAGDFATDITLTINLNAYYATNGITLYGDGTGEYPASLTVTWFQNSTQLATQDYTPDSDAYYCERLVSNYNIVTLTFHATSLPARRLKITQYMAGIIKTFTASELTEYSAINESHPLSIELPSSSMHARIESKDNIDYFFVARQPMKVYHGENLIGTYYIDSANHVTEHGYEIDCLDAIGVLGKQQFRGAAYLSGASAKAIIAAIIGTVYDVEYSQDVTDTTLYGVIKATTKRDALQQVLFAWGVAARTDRSNKIIIYKPSSGTATVKDTSKIYLSPSVNASAPVTEINLTAHSFAVDSSGNIEIGGVKYSDTQTVYTWSNPNLTAFDMDNVVDITDATLVSSSNYSALLAALAVYYQRRNSFEGDLVLESENLGDKLTVATNLGSNLTGNVTKLSMNISNTIKASTEILEVNA